ncbi:hypothetical protein Bbelb_116260 [Branchiostoma belcheri]|nr:hypothetical protein Bbelb_116260 [Branchiostoma belcheri]
MQVSGLVSRSREIRPLREQDGLIAIENLETSQPPANNGPTSRPHILRHSGGAAEQYSRLQPTLLPKISAVFGAPPRECHKKVTSSLVPTTPAYFARIRCQGLAKHLAAPTPPPIDGTPAPRHKVPDVNIQLNCGYQKADHTGPPQSPG